VLGASLLRVEGLRDGYWNTAMTGIEQLVIRSD
jgi:hypothetical protein